MIRLRVAVGAELRRRRQAQGRTLREVAAEAGVSLTYLSEIERGRKEASSEVLAAICAALDLILSDLLFQVAEALAALEAQAAPVIVTRPPVAVQAPASPARVYDFQAFAARRSA